jgi:hypothetical protein
MGEVINSGLRLMRLYTACWSKDQLTLADIQSILSGEDEPDLSPETLSNYIASLAHAGVVLKRKPGPAPTGQYWVVEAVPPFPWVAIAPCVPKVYKQIRQLTPRYPIGFMDKLLGIAPTHKNDSIFSAQQIEEQWHRAYQYRQVCDVLTLKRWWRVVPMQGYVNNAQTIALWDVELQLPVRLHTIEIMAFKPILDYQPEVIASRIIVQFEISGPLMQRFDPAPGDAVLETTPNYIRVAHRCEDAIALSNRILRYQTCCRIIAPNSFKTFLLQELQWLQSGRCVVADDPKPDDND